MMPTRACRVSTLVFSSENRLAALQVIMMMSSMNNQFPLMGVIKLYGRELGGWHRLGCYRRFPLNQLQIQHRDRVDRGDQQQRHKGRDRQATNLRVAERFP